MQAKPVRYSEVRIVHCVQFWSTGAPAPVQVPYVKIYVRTSLSSSLSSSSLSAVPISIFFSWRYIAQFQLLWIVEMLVSHLQDPLDSSSPPHTPVSKRRRQIHFAGAQRGGFARRHSSGLAYRFCQVFDSSSHPSPTNKYQVHRNSTPYFVLSTIVLLQLKRNKIRKARDVGIR